MCGIASASRRTPHHARLPSPAAFAPNPLRVSVDAWRDRRRWERPSFQEKRWATRHSEWHSFRKAGSCNLTRGVIHSNLKTRTLHALCTPNATWTLHPTPHTQTRDPKTDSILLEDSIRIAQHPCVEQIQNTAFRVLGSFKPGPEPDRILGTISKPKTREPRTRDSPTHKIGYFEPESPYTPGLSPMLRKVLDP